MTLRQTPNAALTSLISLISLIGLVTIVTALSCRKTSKLETVVYTSVDQVFSEPIFRYCEGAAGIVVRTLFDTEETKSTGVLNRLIAEASNVQADVFWSGDPVRPFALIDRALIEPYVSPAASGLPETLRAKDGLWTGFAARARVLLVDNKRVANVDTPHSIRDLANPKWKGQTAIANPLFGTTTMHVAALFSVWGESQATTFLAQLKGNAVRVASSNGDVKKLVVSGEMAFGLTDTDDAYEAIAEGADVRVVYPDQQGIGTLVMPTVVVLLKGGPHPKRGRQLIDCLLSGEVEKRLAASAAHMPLRPGTQVPPTVRSIESIKAMTIDYAAVAKTMEQIQPWLREWTQL